jgi:hypothetical protein
MSKKCALTFVFLIGTLIVLPASSLIAQECAFIPEDLARLLRNELSGDRGFEYIRWMSHYHRPSGSRGYMEVAKLLEKWSREFGLERVQVVDQKYGEGRSNWDALSGELWVVEPEEIKLGSYAEIAVSVPNNCPTAHETVELVYVGEGRTDEDFAGLEVVGKAVLTSSSASAVMRTAVWERGAAGVVSFSNSRPNAVHDFPDQVAYSRLPLQSDDGRPSKWAFMISPRKGSMLIELLDRAHREGKAVKVKVDIETEFHQPVKQTYAWAEIGGSEIPNQDIVLTAHIQEEKASANDDSSGCASILEIGRTISRLVREGRIPRPRRDIIFWWANEISSEYQYFRDHPEERRNMLININQDMVGAKQSMGSRVQHIIRTPYSMPSYLSDVIESITEYVILTNTAFLAAGQARTPQPFSKPILSHLGTRERYNAMVVPYFNNSDHMVFCERMIGIPGVGLINWPDSYIHSTADDLDNIDQTQLKRNAFVVAATALFVANAGDAEVPLIASEVYTRGLRRIGSDLNTGLQHILQNKAKDDLISYREARNLLERAIIRESRALESVLVFAEPGGKSAAHVKGLIGRLANQEKDYLNRLDEAYVLASGERKAPKLRLTDREKVLAAKVPENIESVDEYFEKRGRRVSVKGLHSLMAWECFNFVDGRNSYLDIFRAVQAEALSVGAYYYGTVSMAAVEELLNRGVESGFIRLKGNQGR